MKIFGIESKKMSVWLAVIFAAAAFLAWVSFLASGGLQTIREGHPWPSKWAGNSNDEVIVVDENRSFPADNVRELDIHVRFAQVNILPIDGDEVTMRYHGSVWTPRSISDDVFTTSISEGLLRAESLWGSAEIQRSDVVLEVGIPTGANLSLRVDGASGSVTLTNLELKDLDVRVSSGPIEAVGIKARTASMHTSSGSVRAWDWIVGSGAITTSSGHLELESIDAEGTLVFEASSGNVVGTNLSASALKGRAVSGKTELRGLTGSLAMNGSSGNVTAVFTDPGDSIGVDLASGRIKVGLPSGAAFSLDAQTLSGDVSSTFPITVTGSMEKRRLKGQSGSEGTRKITLSTSSGDIVIEAAS